MQHTMMIGIRGAGVAGLACARAIGERLPGAALHLFDVRPAEPCPMRTFCFFGGADVDVGVVPAKRWQRVQFAGEGFRRTVECSETPYTLVRGEDFFRQAMRVLTKRGVEFTWSCRSVELATAGVVVDGERRPFDVVIDAAFSSSGCSPVMWQSFAGMVIETEERSFDPGEAIVMDLVPSSVDAAVGFVYVLPFSATEALIEHTTFSPTPLAPEEHFAGAARWLARRGIVVRHEVSRESGAIPMGLPSGEWTPWPVVGTMGGAVRAGTGYGFLGIHRQAAALAEELATVGRVPSGWRHQPTPLVLRTGDALFLRALQRAPLVGAELLAGILKRARDRDIIAFLGGSAGVGQSLRVMGRVPKMTMVRALW